MFGVLATVAARFLGVEEVTPQMFMIRPPAEKPIDPDAELTDEDVERQVKMLQGLIGGAPPKPKPTPPPAPAAQGVKLKRAAHHDGRVLKGSPLGPNDDAPAKKKRPRTR